MTILGAAKLGTVAFTVAVVAGVVAPGSVGLGTAAVSIALFATGCLAFARTLLRAAERSRTEELTVSGIWFLSGSAPAEVRRLLLGALAVQVAVALFGAGIRPFTALAFGILAPVFGLGLCGLWAVAHGSFPPRRGRGR